MPKQSYTVELMSDAVGVELACVGYFKRIMMATDTHVRTGSRRAWLTQSKTRTRALAMPLVHVVPACRARLSVREHTRSALLPHELGGRSSPGRVLDPRRARMVARFSVRLAIVVEADHLKEPWVVDSNKIDGGDFVMLSQQDRKFARAMGRDCNERCPWASNGLIPHVQTLRDDAMDRMLVEYMRSNDPLADAEARLPARGRHCIFHAANVPEIITINAPPFTTADGTRIGEFSMRVISTPRRKSNITVELTLALLSWAIVAVGQFEGNAFKRPRRERNLITLTQPNCQWRQRDRPAIFCRYRTADGDWKVHMETPWKSVDESMQTSIIREVEARAQRFYEENHVPVADESPSPRA